MTRRRRRSAAGAAALGGGRACECRGRERVASGAERVVVQAWAHAGDGGSEDTADGERQRYAERCRCVWYGSGAIQSGGERGELPGGRESLKRTR